MYPKFFLFLFAFISCLAVKAFEVGLVSEHFKSEKFDFKINSFIDGRINKTKYVGYTQLGTFKGIEDLFLPVDFGKYCNDFFKAAPIKFKNKKTFCAVINQVSIQEIADGSTQYSDVSLSIDYYLVDTIKQECSLYYRSYLKSIKASEFDITKKHALNLSNAFLTSFLNLTDYINSKVSLFNYPSLKTNTLKDSLDKKLVLSKDTVIKDGVYYSTKQLYQNAPDIEMQKFLASIDTSRLELYLNEKVEVLMGPTCYAFVKNGILYPCVRKKLYHQAVIDFRHKLICVIDVNSKKSTIMNESASKPYYMFGIAGAIVGDVINAKKVQGDVLYIDLDNGLIGK